MLFCTKQDKEIYLPLQQKIWNAELGNLGIRGTKTVKRLVVRTESLKFSIESSFSKIALTPGWRFSLISVMTKQMPVIKNFTNAVLLSWELTCSGFVLRGIPVFLSASLTEKEEGSKTFFVVFRFCFGFFWLFFGVHRSVLAYVGSLLMLRYHQQYCTIAKLL